VAQPTACMIMSGSPAFLTETAHEALQDYHHDPHQHHHHGGVTYVDAAPAYSSNKTIDLIGEEFVKKEGSPTLQHSLPSLSYTTTTIPTISSGGGNGGDDGSGGNVLYYNLDDLSRYMPEDFRFDESGGGGGHQLVEGMTVGGVEEEAGRAMMISLPAVGEKGGTQSFSIQLKAGGTVCATGGGGNNTNMVSIPTIDTTKLTGQLSVVQELPEVSKLVFQEVKSEDQDSIVNILEHMKEEHDPASLSPLDYSTADAPLNLANNKGVKRMMVGSQPLVDSKRLKNVLVLQNGQQILHQLPVTSLQGLSQVTAIKTLNGDLDDLSALNYIDPPSPKSENKAKNAALKLTYPTKTVAGTVIPSSKTCNWVFENGQVCGKTFSKSYNLVVHMRMHEDIRPFACTLCDQTFRQKAHLQRHETTHGIQSKNVYRNPPGGNARRRANAKARASPKMSKGLQERLSAGSAGITPKKEDSEGEEMVEDEEEDSYVPHGGSTAKRNSDGGRKYSNSDCQGEDRELDSDTALYQGGRTTEPMHAGSYHRTIIHAKDKLQVGGGGGGSEGEMIAALNLAAGSRADDDTSTVQDILHTVNSVPTLEQKMEASFLNCESLLLKTSRGGRGVARLAMSEDTYVSTSNNNLPTLLSTTLSQNLPGSLAQTNLLSTLSNSKLVSLVEASSTKQQQQQQHLIIDNLEDHSPEIQAELLNAFLADETYSPAAEEEEEVIQEEIYRLNTLPSTWWVLRRRKQGSPHSPTDITYYSPQGLGFKTKAEIQNFLTHNIISRETKMAGLRHPPIPVETIPVIDDDLPSVQAGLDANSIAQVLIANLKPEPMENLQEALSDAKLEAVAVSMDASLSNPATPIQATS